MDHSYLYHFIFLSILKLLFLQFKDINVILKCPPNYIPGGIKMSWCILNECQDTQQVLNSVTSLLLYHIATSYDLKIKKVTSKMCENRHRALMHVIWQHLKKNSTARKFNEEIRIYLFNHNIICFITVKLCNFPVRKNKCKLESLRMLNKI